MADAFRALNTELAGLSAFSHCLAAEDPGAGLERQKPNPRGFPPHRGYPHGGGRQVRQDPAGPAQCAGSMGGGFQSNHKTAGIPM